MRIHWRIWLVAFRTTNRVFGVFFLKMIWTSWITRKWKVTPMYWAVLHIFWKMPFSDLVAALESYKTFVIIIFFRNRICLFWTKKKKTKKFDWKLCLNFQNINSNTYISCFECAVWWFRFSIKVQWNIIIWMVFLVMKFEFGHWYRLFTLDTTNGVRWVLFPKVIYGIGTNTKK